MILFFHSFCEFVPHIPLVPMAFYCSWKLHGCIGMLRLLEQYLIVITGSRQVLFMAIFCPISSLGNCHLPLQLLLWSDVWTFVLLFLLNFVDDSLVELTVLCIFSWFLLCTLLRLHCQGCVLLVVLCPIRSALSILSGKLLLWILLISFSLVLRWYSFHQLPLTPWYIDCLCLTLLGSVLFGCCAFYQHYIF